MKKEVWLKWMANKQIPLRFRLPHKIITLFTPPNSVMLPQRHLVWVSRSILGDCKVSLHPRQEGSLSYPRV